MVARVKKRLADAYRPTTRRNQDAAFMAFVMYAIFHEIDIRNVQIFMLLAFVEFLVDSKLAIATIKNYISSLKARFNMLTLKTGEFQSPKLSFMLASLEKNQHVKFKPKPIITTLQFKTIFIKSQSLPFKQFFRVAILFAYMAFMRIFNLAPKNVAQFDSLRDIRRGGRSCYK
jgi:hypothetical protein